MCDIVVVRSCTTDTAQVMASDARTCVEHRAKTVSRVTALITRQPLAREKLLAGCYTPVVLVSRLSDAKKAKEQCKCQW